MYEIGQKPGQGRQFTTAEAAAALGISEPTVYSIVKVLNLPYDIRRQEHGPHRVALFSYEVLKEIELYTKAKSKKQMIKNYTGMRLKAEEHPLVTDERWLNMNDWPEVVPSILRGIE